MAHAIEDYGRSRVSYSTPQTVNYSKPSTSNALKNSKTNTQMVNTSKKQDNIAVIYTPSKQSTPIKPVTYSAPKPNKVDQQVAASNKEAAKTSPNALSVAKNFFGGVYDAGKSTVEGMVNIVKHPVKTAEAIVSAAVHPVQTATAIKNAAVTTYNDFKKGDANVKAHMIGRLTGEVALAVVGTKGVDKAVKATEAVANVAKVEKVVDKVTQISKNLSKTGKLAESNTGLRISQNITSLGKSTAKVTGKVDDSIRKNFFEATAERDSNIAKSKAAETTGRTSKADTLKQNKANGNAYEKEIVNKMSQTHNNVQSQITVKTESGVKTRLDAIGANKQTGKVEIVEAKASKTAPLTRNQAEAHPEIAKSGATVVGKGKEPYVGGTKIPATKVEIVRKK